jgi:hypothetical protein
MIRLVPASVVHVGPIATRMRPADVAECAAFGHSPKEALRRGIAASVDCFTALVNGRPEAMMGLRPGNLLEGLGQPWMLGTEAIYENPRAMLALGPKVIALWRDSTPNLRNLVWSENVRAIRMLRRWGFEIGDEVEMIRGLTFVNFTMGPGHV